MGAIKSTISLVDKMTAPMMKITNTVEGLSKKIKVAGTTADSFSGKGRSMASNVGNAFSSMSSQAVSSLNRIGSTMEQLGSKSSMLKSMLGADIIEKGVSLVTSQLDSALSRSDTLNNFPRVMSNLGIDSEDATDSINSLSDRLQGLPTTLQDAASSVQRFTSANGNIGASTEMFLALNNAILAGGADMATQSSALEQLSQSYAKGKPDMMEWRSAMTAMPAQLKQVAKVMGYVNADELGESLRNGKTSMNEFMDTLVRMNTESVNGFKSFDEQARNSTDGFATSIANLKSAVTRGLTNAINNINATLAESGLPKIQDIISKIGKGIEKVLSVVGTVLGKVVSWVGQHQEQLLSLAQTVLTVAASWMAVQTAISAIISIVSVVKTVVTTFGSVGGAVFGVAIVGAVILAAQKIKELISWVDGLQEHTGDTGHTVELVFARLQVTLAKIQRVGVTVFNSLAIAGNTLVLGLETAFKGLAGAIVGICGAVVEVVETMVNIGVAGINALIDVANLIPGVDLIHADEMDVSKGLYKTAGDLFSSITDSAVATDLKNQKLADAIVAQDDKVANAQKNYDALYKKYDKKNYKKVNSVEGKLISSGLDGVTSNTGKTAANTKNIANSLKANGEVLKYIKDYATQKAINRYTSSTVKVNVTNNNDIASNVDADGFITKLKNTIENEISANAEGVHI